MGPTVLGASRKNAFWLPLMSHAHEEPAAARHLLLHSDRLLIDAGTAPPMRGKRGSAVGSPASRQGPSRDVREFRARRGRRGCAQMLVPSAKRESEARVSVATV